MLDVRKLLAKILNWSGFEYTWEFATANTADTWIPVLTGKIIQHRVIPSDTVVACTKVNSYWTSGSIQCFRKGNCCQLRFNSMGMNATSGTQNIALIPVGFRPPTETRLPADGNYNVSFFAEPTGYIQARSVPAGTYWGTVTYPV